MSVDQSLVGEALGGAKTTPGGSAATDGRLLRSERTKQAIVDAFLALIKEGALRPSSARIAERAGVTQRTLFNQFGDMETLFEAVTQRHIARVSDLFPKATEGTLEARVTSFAGMLAQLLDEVMNIRWAVITSADGLERFGKTPHLFAAVMRHQLNTAFDEELSKLRTEDRRALVDILEIEADPLTWRLRRLQQNQSLEEARDRVEHAMLALLRCASTA